MAKKKLIMNEAELAEFEKKCLDHLPYATGKQIVNYLRQFLKDEPEEKKEAAE